MAGRTAIAAEHLLLTSQAPMDQAVTRRLRIVGDDSYLLATRGGRCLATIGGSTPAARIKVERYGACGLITRKIP